MNKIEEAIKKEIDAVVDRIHTESYYEETNSFMLGEAVIKGIVIQHVNSIRAILLSDTLDQQDVEPLNPLGEKCLNSKGFHTSTQQPDTEIEPEYYINMATGIVTKPDQIEKRKDSFFVSEPFYSQQSIDTLQQERDELKKEVERLKADEDNLDSANNDFFKMAERCKKYIIKIKALTSENQRYRKALEKVKTEPAHGGLTAKEMIDMGNCGGCKHKELIAIQTLSPTEQENEE